MEMITYLQTRIIYVKSKISITNLEWGGLIVNQGLSNDIEL